MSRPARQRVHRYRARRAGPAGRIVVPWPPGGLPWRWTFAVVHLTVQGSAQQPHPQPSCSRAVTNGVSGQLVNGQDYIFSSAFRQACLAGLRPYLSSQRAERAGVKREIEDWRHAVMSHRPATIQVVSGRG